TERSETHFSNSGRISRGPQKAQVMNPLNARWKGRMKTVQDSESRTEATDLAGHGSKITAERCFLVLRWSTDDVAKAMESAGLSLEDLLVKHLFPCLESMKTLC